MLYLFTDFGWQGPYIGQMKSKAAESTRYYQIIDLMHDVPAFNIKAGGYLLSAVTSYLPADSVIVAVVDPLVGSDQKAVVLRADYRWFVGPDNGLFDIVSHHASSCRWYDINELPSNVSRSFHGRDIFVPVASKLILAEPCESFLSSISRSAEHFFDADLNEVIYIDQFGNLMTGLRAKKMPNLKSIRFANQQLKRANTFSDVAEGQAFFYENSQGLIEIAINCGSAQAIFAANIGDPIFLE